MATHSVLGDTKICKRSPLWQLPLPTTCPWHSERSQKSHIPPENWKCQPRRIHAFHDEILVMAGKQTSWSAGPFQTSAPAEHEIHLLQTSFLLPMLTHTPKQLTYKNKYQQIISNFWKLINWQERWATEILNPVSLLKRCLGMDNRRDIWTNTNSLQRVIAHGVWPAETTGGGYKGMLEALPAEAGAMLSHFSRCHFWELLLELSSQMWKPSPTNTQATQAVNCFPKTHCTDQWTTIFLILVLVRVLSCFPSLTSLL